MANWLLPTTASTYVNYTTELDARLDDLALGLDPAFVTVTNAPTNTQRWNSVGAKWEKYNGTAWADLAATYNINAATASAWATGRTVSLTGDVTAASSAWTGSANLSIAATLATVNSNTGSFGSTSAIPIITVNAKGLITAVSTASLGTMAAQSASAVAVTGGSISGTTLTFKQSTTAAPTAEGVVEWDTDDDVLKIGTGAGTKTLVNTDNAQTLTNKTLSTSSIWNGSTIAVAYGGTGAPDAATARTNLGIASMGTQASNAVAITGGAISGTGITLVQSTTAAPTAEGAIEWDIDDDVLVLGTAGGSKIQVNTDGAQTLTNKTLSTGSVWNGDVIAAGYIATLNQSTTGNAATATKLATARTINTVAFDGSGNIIITANTTNALTFNNDGSGGTSGTWNGSAAKTISYNTIGAPSVTGANASGTWGISIAGNAATVTNGVYTTGVQTLAGTVTVSGSTFTLGQFTAVAGSGTAWYNAILRNDGTDVYLMSSAVQTTQAAANTATWNAYRPFSWNLSTGVVTISQAGQQTNIGGSVVATGNISGASDERLKKNWRDLNANFIEELATVKMGIYDRTDNDMTQVGVSAQSLQRILPWAVSEGANGMLSVSYGNAALAACVAMARELTTLRNEINLLKGSF